MPTQGASRKSGGEKSGLVLRGRVHTYYAKQLVQHAVMEASSLPIRANEMEVA